MAKGEQRGNRESKKPKKEKIKTIAAAPSQKGAAAGWQPTFGQAKRSRAITSAHLERIDFSREAGPPAFALKGRRPPSRN